MRAIAWGYRVDEVELPKVGPAKKNTVIRKVREKDTQKRRIVQVSLGVIVSGFAMPHPDPDDDLSLKMGILKRISFDPPKPLVGEYDYLMQFTCRWMHDNLIPLSSDHDISFDSWIKSRPYPNWRKIELIEVYEKSNHLFDTIDWYNKQLQDFAKCNCFEKDETYPEYKYPRGIFSRTDEIKCQVGPIFSAISDVVFKLPEFIKKIPVSDRPRYIVDKMYRPGAYYICTDHSSFEAHITADIMRCIEFPIYRYMVKDLPKGHWFVSLIEPLLSGTNVCKFNAFELSVEAGRMSGEMNTSLGNGLVNLITMSYLCHKHGVEANGVVEGDDGLFVFDSPVVTSEDYLELGMTVKLEVRLEVTSASFCGIVCDKEEMRNFTDVREQLVRFGWTTGNYSNANLKTKKTLLRAKAMSLAAQYPGCPILEVLAWKVIELTNGIGLAKVLKLIRSNKKYSEYEKERILLLVKDFSNIKPVGVSDHSRVLLQQMQNIDVETQLIVEQEICNKKDLSSFKFDVLDFPIVWKHYWDNYVGYMGEQAPCSRSMELLTSFSNRTRIMS